MHSAKEFRVLHYAGNSEYLSLRPCLWFHLQLPLKVDIIKHPNEADGKSTAVHAKLLAPEDVTIYTYPCIPDYEEMKHEVRDCIAVR